LQEEKNPELRKAAVYALGDKTSKEAVDILVKVVKTDENLVVRKAAIDVLGQIGTPEAQQTLMEILENR